MLGEGGKKTHCHSLLCVQFAQIFILQREFRMLSPLGIEEGVRHLGRLGCCWPLSEPCLPASCWKLGSLEVVFLVFFFFFFSLVVVVFLCVCVCVLGQKVRGEVTEREGETRGREIQRRARTYFVQVTMDGQL